LYSERVTYFGSRNEFESSEAIPNASVRAIIDSPSSVSKNSGISLRVSAIVKLSFFFELRRDKEREEEGGGLGLLWKRGAFKTPGSGAQN
jgi:hypothetical protein